MSQYIVKFDKELLTGPMAGSHVGNLSIPCECMFWAEHAAAMIFRSMGKPCFDLYGEECIFSNVRIERIQMFIAIDKMVEFGYN